MSAARWLPILALALPFAVEAAGVYKCQDANGKTAYQDTACPAGKKLDTQFNSIDTAPNPEIAAKAREFDKGMQEHLRGRAVVNEANARAANEKYRYCQRYRDQIARQEPWLNARSDVARASAMAEIRIAWARLRDAQC